MTLCKTIPYARLPTFLCKTIPYARLLTFLCKTIPYASLRTFPCTHGHIDRQGHSHQDRTLVDRLVGWFDWLVGCAAKHAFRSHRHVAHWRIEGWGGNRCHLQMPTPSCDIVPFNVVTRELPMWCLCGTRQHPRFTSGVATSSWGFAWTSAGLPSPYPLAPQPLPCVCRTAQYPSWTLPHPHNCQSQPITARVLQPIDTHSLHHPHRGLHKLAPAPSQQCALLVPAPSRIPNQVASKQPTGQRAYGA